LSTQGNYKEEIKKIEKH